MVSSKVVWVRCKVVLRVVRGNEVRDGQQRRGRGRAKTKRPRWLGVSLQPPPPVVAVRQRLCNCSNCLASDSFSQLFFTSKT